MFLYSLFSHTSSFTVINANIVPLLLLYLTIDYFCLRSFFCSVYFVRYQCKKGGWRLKTGRRKKENTRHTHTHRQGSKSIKSYRFWLSWFFWYYTGNVISHSDFDQTTKPSLYCVCHALITKLMLSIKAVVPIIFDQLGRILVKSLNGPLAPFFFRF